MCFWEHQGKPLPRSGKFLKNCLGTSIGTRLWCWEIYKNMGETLRSSFWKHNIGSWKFLKLKMSFLTIFRALLLTICDCQLGFYNLQAFCHWDPYFFLLKLIKDKWIIVHVICCSQTLFHFTFTQHINFPRRKA